MAKNSFVAFKQNNKLDVVISHIQLKKHNKKNRVGAKFENGWKAIQGGRAVFIKWGEVRNHLPTMPFIAT